MKILISADVEIWTTRARDTSDSWDQGDTDGRVSNVSAWEDRSGQEHHSYGVSCQADLDVRLGDTVYAVVADYSSGSTFGRDGGHAQVLDAFATVEEAEALVKAALAEPENGRSEFAFEHNGKDYHRNWVGYFESLNELTVWHVDVRRNPGDPIRKGSGRYSHKHGR